jgi:hypothetical protein
MAVFFSMNCILSYSAFLYIWQNAFMTLKLYLSVLRRLPILNCIERRSIKWYGHVLRMQDYRKPKQAMEARREKGRGRGRPTRTGEDCDKCCQEKRKDSSRFEETGLRQNCF